MFKKLFNRVFRKRIKSQGTEKISKSRSPKPSTQQIKKQTTSKKKSVFEKRIAKGTKKVELLMNKLQLSGSQRVMFEKWVKLDKIHTKKAFDRLEKISSQIKDGSFNYKKWFPDSQQRKSFDEKIKQTLEQTGKLPTLNELFQSFDRTEFYIKNQEIIKDYNDNYYEPDNPFEKQLREQWDSYNTDKIANLLKD